MDAIGREFRDEAQQSLYPFSDSASLQTRDGLLVEIGTFLDASVYLAGSQARLGITSIATAADGQAEIALGDAGDARRATSLVDLSAGDEVLLIRDSNDRPAGQFVVDPGLIASWRSWPLGTHTFLAGAAELVASCVIPLPEIGVRALADVAGQIHTGHAWIVGEQGVVVLPANNGSGIEVHVVGDPLFVRRLCDPAGAQRLDVKVLKTINGIGPQPDGSFLVVSSDRTPDTILRIVPTPPSTLTISAVGKSLTGVRT
jgi:hypothetical protein